MKQSLLALTLCTAALGAAAQGTAGDTQSGHETERFIYLNGSLTGLFKVCTRDGDPVVYLSEAFFEQSKLLKGAVSMTCGGKRYDNATVSFSRNDAAATMTATATAADFAKTVNAIATERKDSVNPNAPKGEVTQASVLQHSLGAWANSSGAISATGSVVGSYFASMGLLSINGYASVADGAVQASVNDLGWKRAFAEQGLNAYVGVNTVSAFGTSRTLKGLLVETDETRSEQGHERVIEGFADAPGTIVVKQRGAVLGEFEVPAGAFRLPLASLHGGSSGGMATYTLSLVDAQGKTVREWEYFMPPGTRLLSAGATLWRVYLGQSNSEASSGLHLGGGRLAAGGAVMRGVTKDLTVEAAVELGPGSAAAALTLNYVPADWIAFSASQTLARGPSLPSRTSYAAVDLSQDHVGVTLGVARNPCTVAAAAAGASTSPAAAASTPSISVASVAPTTSAACTAARLGAYVGASWLGRVALQYANSGTPGSSGASTGFSWTLPTIGPVAISLYGSRSALFGARTTSYGISASLPLGSGQLINTYTASGPGTGNLASNWQGSGGRELQYSIGAEWPVQGQASGGALRGSASLNPWHGNYQASATVDRGGRVEVGLNEAGALVVSNGEWLISKQSDQGYAIVRLQDLPQVSLESQDGRRQTVTNANGYAVLPASSGGAPAVRVAADEIPATMQTPETLIGEPAQKWQATLWEPRVRHVNRGWIRLLREGGQAVPIGSGIFFANGAQPAYVLDGGDTFIEDLPADQRRLEVRFPIGMGHCYADLPSPLVLSAQFRSNKPSFNCTDKE